MDTDACDKVTSFLVLCDSFNIPIVMLVDTPGFSIGIEAERSRAPGKIMNFMQALQLCTVPKLSVILRKSYGQAYLNMGGGRNSDEVAAWPTAEVSFMDPTFAVKIVHGLEPGEPGFDEAFAQMNKDSEPWDIAAIYAVQSDHPAARDARLSDPHARGAPPAPDRRRRPASHARLADQLLGGRQMAEFRGEVGSRRARSGRSSPRSARRSSRATPS